MAAPLHLFSLLCVYGVAALVCSAASPLCPRSDLAFLDSLRSQCPVWIERSPAVEVSGDTLDKELDRGREGVYYSVLFYASWCPFSRRIRPIFDALSSMYPHTIHLAVEDSSAMPSVFSRYGIHSFPTILIVNRTAMVHYYGPKDLRHLVHFYKEITGLSPAADFDADQPNDPSSSWSPWPWIESPIEAAANEPYLAFGLMFILLKAFFRVFPMILARLKLFWVSYAWRLNMGILDGLSHLLKRAIHLIDVKKLWDRLRLCDKARRFRNSAKSARVWASSLASVSLGESSSRLAHSD